MKNFIVNDVYGGTETNMELAIAEQLVAKVDQRSKYQCLTALIHDTLCFSEPESLIGLERLDLSLANIAKARNSCG